MNEIETTVWALVYAAAVAVREPDPGSIADNAVLRFKAGEKLHEENNEENPED